MLPTPKIQNYELLNYSKLKYAIIRLFGLVGLALELTQQVLHLRWLASPRPQFSKFVPNDPSRGTLLAAHVMSGLPSEGKARNLQWQDHRSPEHDVGSISLSGVTGPCV